MTNRLGLCVVAGSLLWLVACTPQRADEGTSRAAAPAARDAADADAEATPANVIAAFERNFGVHRGQRRNHTKGSCALGEFVGDPAVQAWSRSALFAGTPIPVVARFSLPGGNPQAPDAGQSPRGMALEFRLPDGALQHMTMLNVPVFSAATPQSFFAGLLAATPDPRTGKPDPARLRAWRESHPDSAPQAAFMAHYRPPASYGSTTYHGIHAFRLLDAHDAASAVRWQFVPEDGERTLTPEEAAQAPTDFLEAALIERVARGPLRWRMELVFAEPGDPLDDPTRAWPAERRHVSAGTLSITAAMPQAGAECEHINFDPMVLADGIAPSDDPILAFRSPTYALSFARRMSEQAAGTR